MKDGEKERERERGKQITAFACFASKAFFDQFSHRSSIKAHVIMFSASHRLSLSYCCWVLLGISSLMCSGCIFPHPADSLLLSPSPFPYLYKNDFNDSSHHKLTHPSHYASPCSVFLLLLAFSLLADGHGEIQLRMERGSKRSAAAAAAVSHAARRSRTGKERSRETEGMHHPSGKREACFFMPLPSFH